MPFKKATHEESRLKVALYGPPGSGKTYTALLLAEGLVAGTKKRVAIIDTEKGTRYYDVERPGDTVHPEPFDFDRVHTRSLAEATAEVEQLDYGRYGVIIIDSISHLWDAAQDAIKERTRAGTIKMQDWGKVKKPYKALIDRLMQAPIDVLILGRQKNIFEEDGAGEIKKVGVTMRAEGETPHEPDIVIQMHQDRADHSVQAYVEKDRTSVLSGKTLRNPKFSDFAGLLPLLGRTHQGMQTDEDRLDKDVEMVLADEAKAKLEEEQSAVLCLEFQGKLVACKTKEALDAVAAEIKKARKGLVDKDRAQLLELHEQVMRTLTRKA